MPPWARSPVRSGLLINVANQSNHLIHSECGRSFASFQGICLLRPILMPQLIRRLLELSQQSTKLQKATTQEASHQHLRIVSLELHLPKLHRTLQTDHLLGKTLDTTRSPGVEVDGRRALRTVPVVAHSRICLSDAVSQASSFIQSEDPLGGHWDNHHGLLTCPTVLARHRHLPLGEYTTARFEYVFEIQHDLFSVLGDDLKDSV